MLVLLSACDSAGVVMRLISYEKEIFHHLY
jgi:hypothetical protein